MSLAVARQTTAGRRDRLTNRAGSQTGVTLIGFLILVALFGTLGYACLRLVPMYMNNLKLGTVLNDVRTELNGHDATARLIRTTLEKHFDIEGIELPPGDVKITQGRDGYDVRIQHESRAHYLADIYLVVAFDKQVNIRR